MCDEFVTPLVANDLVCEVEAARLLEGVALKAGRGQFIGLIGPNGAGKSTLLRAISGLIRRDGGSVVLEGRDLSKMSARDIARVMANVPQIASYTYGFTGLEVAIMGRYPWMGRFQVEGAADRRIALEAMRLTETDAFADRPVTTLSGGERQRVFVARALAQEPRILLLDEPTSNLDIQHQLRVLTLIQDLVAVGMTAIAAIHDLSLAARYCHRLLLMSRGRVLAEGPPEEVLTPANMEAAFGVRAVVYRDQLTGKLTLSLLEACEAERKVGDGTRVHVVCGGGSGANLMYELKRAGFTVTAGALGAGDTDRRAAEVLGVEYVSIPAFGAIDDDAHARHLELVASSDFAVLYDMPIGANNIRNLEALIGVERLVYIETVPLAQRDFTGGAAQRLFEKLRYVAFCRTPAEAVSFIRNEVRRSLNSETEPAGERSLKEE